MYIQFVDRHHFGTGFVAQLAGPDQREILKNETLDGLKSEVLEVVDDEDVSRVEYLFAAMAAKEGAVAKSRCVATG